MFTLKNSARRAMVLVMCRLAGGSTDRAGLGTARKRGGILTSAYTWLAAAGLAVSAVSATGPQTMAANGEVPLGEASLYISSASAGVYKSLDGGESWSWANEGLGNLIVYDLAGGLCEGLGYGELFAGTVDGVYRTTNGGGSWTGCGLEGLRVRGLDIDPATKTVYAATEDGIYATSARRERIYWWRVGLAGHDIRQVCVCYGQNNYIYAAGAIPAAVETRVFKSSDGGQTWSSVLVFNYYHAWALAVNPEDPAYVYVSIGDAFLTGYARSTDGGKSWEYGPFEGVPDIDTHRAHTDTVYLCEHSAYSGVGIWKSADRGDTWTQVFDNTGYWFDFVSSIALHRHSESVMYCTASRFEGDVLPELYFGKTCDDGETWTFYDEGLPQGSGSDILLDALYPRALPGNVQP